MTKPEHQKLIEEAEKLPDVVTPPPPPPVSGRPTPPDMPENLKVIYATAGGISEEAAWQLWGPKEIAPVIPPAPPGMPQNLLHLYNAVGGITPEVAYEHWGRAGSLQVIRAGNVKYSGRVRAIAPCHYTYLRAVGDEWEVTEQTLWTDDPFVPIKVAYTNPGTGAVDYKPFVDGEEGSPLRQDFKSRKLLNVSIDPTPMPADRW